MKSPRRGECGPRYNQRYPTFARFIGASVAYVRLQINLAPNLQLRVSKSSLDIGKFVSYSAFTVRTRFREHRVQNAALASIAPVAVVTCLPTCFSTWPNRWPACHWLRSFKGRAMAPRSSSDLLNDVLIPVAPACIVAACAPDASRVVIRLGLDLRRWNREAVRSSNSIPQSFGHRSR